MTNEIEYQEDRIKKMLSEMSSVYSDIQFREQIPIQRLEEIQFEIETDERKEYFFGISKSLFILCIAYLEQRNLKNYLSAFEKELNPFLTDRVKNLSGSYHEESGEVYSDLVSLFWNYLLSFSTFGDNNDFLLKRTGLIYLEDILQSTAVILKSQNKTPSKETDVYNAVKIVCQATFPSAIFPTESFQKPAKCYKPDILIPSLNCAVEYKYAENEQKLISTIDEILIDVKGYDKHSVYKIFYAVFYVKPGIWTKNKFQEVWKEKEFPANWKAFMVEGG